jgi:hypothetical protein
MCQQVIAAIMPWCVFAVTYTKMQAAVQIAGN